MQPKKNDFMPKIDEKSREMAKRYKEKIFNCVDFGVRDFRGHAAVVRFLSYKL